MKKTILFTITAVLAGTAMAYDYDRLLDAIDVPDGAYFDTGYVVKDHPRVIASISVAELDYDFDLFGVKHRSEGCWILNVDGTTTGGYHPSFYYRHGTASNNGGVGEYSVRQRLDIDCGKTLVVNGEELQSVNDWDFSSNDTTMTIPGTEDAHRFTLMAFKLWDGGVLVRDFLPAEKDGVCGLYDRANDQFYSPASGTVSPAYDQRVDAIHIPEGAYFKTECVVKDNPRVIADVSPDTTGDFDVFGVKPRGEGCWILNVDGAGTSSLNCYYRYGTAAHGTPVGNFSAYQRLLIDCGKTLVVNGTELQTFDDYDFSGNEYQMRVPGNERLNACTIRSFKIEDGGRIVRDFVPAVKNGECGLFDRIAGQFYSNVGSGTVTAEPYDRLLEAIHIPSGTYFNTGCVVTDNPRIIADMSPDTEYDFDLFAVKNRGEGCWILNLDYSVGLGPRFYYRHGTAANNGAVGSFAAGQRMTIECSQSLVVNGETVQTVNAYDFSDNDTAMTVPGTEDPGACTLWSFKIENGGEYVRIFLPAEKNGVCGLYDRVNHQFYAPVSGTATPVATAEPTGLAVKRGEFPNPVAVLSWRPALGSSGTSILRAPGANGPWTEVAQVGEYADTYVDASAPVGVLCHYRVAANYSIGGDDVSLTNETSVAFRRWRLLERDAGDAAHLGDLGHLRSGVNIIYNCGEQAQTPAYENNNTWEAVTNSILLAFNNVLYKSGATSAGMITSSSGYPYSRDWVGVADASPDTCIGVDLGEAAHVAHARFYAVTTASEGTWRVTGLTLFGSNDADWIQAGNRTALTEPLVWSGFCVWHDNDSLDTANAYRYLYYTNPGYQWSGYVSEIQLYGWLDSDLAEVAQAVEDIAVSYGSGTPSVTLTWTPASHGTYTVERKTDDGAWEVVASTLSAATTSWTDSSVVAGTRYTYRITTINGANVAYSSDCTARPYLVGNGTGLHGEWWTNYVATTGGEALALVTTNAMIDIANASVGGETENLFVRWSGKLIAPFAGNYVFDAEGGVYLWIDGNPVLYHRASRGTINLTAGEHDVTAAWQHGDGMGACRLYWSGSVERAVVPASQLVPVVPRTLPEGWTNARSFDADAISPFLGNVTVNADGSLDFAQGGRGIFSGANGYNFLWQPVKGNFTLTAKMVSLPVASQPLWRRAGLMVRSSLDASAMMSVYGVYLDEDDRFYVQSRQKTATDPNIVNQSAVAGAETGPYATTPIWVRLIREGNKFTCLFKSSGSGDWLKAYEYEDVNGEYGKTVYAGLATWGDGYGDDTYVPYYPWRFSDVRLHMPAGTRIIFR